MKFRKITKEDVKSVAKKVLPVIGGAIVGGAVAGVVGYSKVKRYDDEINSVCNRLEHGSSISKWKQDGSGMLLITGQFCPTEEQYIEAMNKHDQEVTAKMEQECRDLFRRKVTNPKVE